MSLIRLNKPVWSINLGDAKIHTRDIQYSNHQNINQIKTTVKLAVCILCVTAVYAQFVYIVYNLQIGIVHPIYSQIFQLFVGTLINYAICAPITTYTQTKPHKILRYTR